jgi:uncharacterized protein (DUF362 family)/Pyruvate/2-oxoacid:ferredoxin oxidoreductase delta subunit
MKPKVAIVKVLKDPETAIKKAIDLLGGIEQFITFGETVLLKPNLFTTKGPETGATTDMSLVLGVANLLKENKCRCILGECPAMASYTRPDIVFDGLGIHKICVNNQIEVRILDRDPPVKVCVDGVVLKDFWFPKTSLDYPIINIPKLKTHALTTLTAAVKNLFGLQQGGTKAHHHVTVKNDAEAFSNLLLDLYEAIKPQVRLNIVDAIIAMEGEGPTNGDPVNLGLIIVGEDSVAVDIVSSALMGWNPMDVGTNFLARKRGIGPKSLNEVEVLGESIDLVKTRFKKPQIHLGDEPFIKIRMPILCDPEKCQECGICAKVCPVGAIEMLGIPEFQDDICIQCFCCTELCPNGAIKAIRPDD